MPVEWITIKGVPLSFSHDVCRIPETPLGGCLNHFQINNTVQYVIEENIFEKILVIFGSDEPLFLEWRKIVEGFKKELKFKTANCATIEEVSNAISKYKPDILIFDCHGGYDSNDVSTYLMIRDEKLTSKIIIDKGIVAPIVFLSACGTAPSYGFFNSIAQGFFEAGALTVTTTFLPVEINKSSIIYVRLLYKLKAAIENNIHKNWLEFVSHIVRTSSVLEAFMASMEKEEAPSKEVSMILTELLAFSKRRGIYRNMDAKLKEISSKNNNAFSNQIPEYLFYSNLGRPDLIYFKKWVNEKRKINN